MSHSNTQYFLSIDNGTQSVRTMLFDAQGLPVARAQVVLPDYLSQETGWSEQDAEVFWEAVGTAANELWLQADADGQVIDRTRVAGISVTTQRATMCFLDENNQSLRPAIAWMDGRYCKQLTDMPWYWRVLIALIGKSKALRFARQKAPSNWMLANQPDVWQNTEHYVQVSGYLNLKLTGEFADGIASQVGFIPFDFKKQSWSAPSEWQWHAYGISPKQLPKLYAAGEKIGQLNAIAAEHLGLHEGIPVFSAGADKASDVLGMGLHADIPEVAAVSLGTRATIVQSVTRYTESKMGMPAYPSLIAGEYLVEEALARGFWLVSWFKRCFASESGNRAIDYAQLESFLQETKQGANGLLLQPTWGSDVEDTPGIRGAVLGLDGTQHQADLYRALVEGIAFGLLNGQRNIERQTKSTIKRIRVSGGGAQSNGVLQILANVLGLPVERIHTVETASLGAAMATAVGLGVYPNLKQAAEHMVRVVDVFEPEPVAHAFYQQLFKQVYRKMQTPLMTLHELLHKANRLR